MEHIVKILAKEFVTHDVLRITTEKPAGFHFTPGQATEVSINQEGWKDKQRPLTICSGEKDTILEFIIKIYPGNEAVTGKLNTLDVGDELLVGEPFGNLSYKGPGLFIAAGTGITPFIAILRGLKGPIGKNRLLFINKSWKDIIFERELKSILGENVRFILSREKREGYDYGHIDKAYLKAQIGEEQNFYICGPMKFVIQMKLILDELGVKPETVIVEL